MPADNTYYYRPTEIPYDRPIPRIPPPKQPEIDPWDLENYIYIREHLDESTSLELTSGSDPQSSGEFLREANSNSFYYVPGNPKMMPAHLAQSRGSCDFAGTGEYAAIEEVPLYDRSRPRSERIYETASTRRLSRSRSNFEPEFEESIYEDRLGREIHPQEIYTTRERLRKTSATYTKKNTRESRDRSISFSYGDNGYCDYPPRQEFYSRLEDVRPRSDYYDVSPIYDDLSKYGHKPKNFSLSNYGHLKIDYSYSWNNLYKIIGN